MGSGVPDPGIPEWALGVACPCSYHFSFLLSNSLLPRIIPHVSLLFLSHMSTGLRAEIVTIFDIAGRDFCLEAPALFHTSLWYAILKVC